MLCSAITASRYFDDSEKDYLQSRLKTLSASSGSDEPQNIKELPRNQINKKPLLNIIQALDTSIKKKLMISISYGSYNYDESRLDHLKLMRKNKKYTLNPYALCWNNGSYYLICTNTGSFTPYHFRVDRILDVKITEDKAEEIPEILAPFFKKEKFNVNEYTRIHPYMAIYDTSDRVDCIFEISADSLSILVDYFGKNIRLTRTTGEKSDILKAELSDIEYSCLRTFVIQHHHIIKVISPTRLADDLKESLSESLRQYD